MVRWHDCSSALNRLHSSTPIGGCSTGFPLPMTVPYRSTNGRSRTSWFSRTEGKWLGAPRRFPLLREPSRLYVLVIQASARLRTQQMDPEYRRYESTQSFREHLEQLYL